MRALKEKANSALHLVSALYWAASIVVIGWVSTLLYLPGTQVRIWIIIGTSAVLLDLWGAALQWHRPASGYVLSISLHFVFALAVVIIGIFEYIESGSASFLCWFSLNNWAFVSVLALLRVIMGVALLPDAARRV